MSQFILLFFGVGLTTFMFVFSGVFLWTWRYNENSHSDFSLTIAIMCFCFGVVFATFPSSWVKKEIVLPGEYTIKHTKHETIFIHDDLRKATDKKYWANLAGHPEKICIYESKGYNLLGFWERERHLLLGEPPCKALGKYEF